MLKSTWQFIIKQKKWVTIIMILVIMLHVGRPWWISGHPGCSVYHGSYFLHIQKSYQTLSTSSSDLCCFITLWSTCPFSPLVSLSFNHALLLPSIILVYFPPCNSQTPLPDVLSRANSLSAHFCGYGHNILLQTFTWQVKKQSIVLPESVHYNMFS